MAFTKETASKAGKNSKRGKGEKTQQWDALGEAISTIHAQRFNDILQTKGDKEFLSAYLQVLNYFKPKLMSSKTDVTSGGDKLSLSPIQWIDNEDTQEI